MPSENAECRARTPITEADEDAEADEASATRRRPRRSSGGKENPEASILAILAVGIDARTITERVVAVLDSYSSSSAE